MCFSAIAGLLGAGASLIGGSMQASAADRAANAQAEASDKSLALQKDALDFQKSTYADARGDSAPWLAAGRTALTTYMGELGMGDPGFQSKFKGTPGYGFAVSEGEKGVTNNLAALGMKNSGSALKALTRFRMGLADQTYNNYLDRVGQVSGMGQGQANDNANGALNLGNSVINSTANMGQTVQDAGTARASGYTGGANAWSNALSGVTNNLSSSLGYMNGGNTNALRLGFQAGV